MTKQEESTQNFEEIKVPLLAAKKAKLIEMAKSEGQDLAPYLRPFLNRIADGELTLGMLLKK